jgi:class 3 adenylate cyclase
MLHAEEYLNQCLQAGTPIDEVTLNQYTDPLERGPGIFVNTIHASRGEIYYLFGDYSRALEHLSKAIAYFQTFGTSLFYFRSLFYYGLSLAVSLPKMKEEKKREPHKQLQQIQKTFSEHAERCPANFSHQALLLTAELAALSEWREEAGRLYEEATNKAKEEEFTLLTAIICERAGEFYFKINQPRFAQLYIQEAYYYYSIWEGKLKTKQLEEKYSFLANRTLQQGFIAPNSMDLQTSTTTSYSIDFLSIIKANRVISSEIILENLLRKLIIILMENAGGQRGLLLVERDGNLIVEAEAFYNKKEVLLNQQSMADRKDLPASILTYVLRTGEGVILNQSSLGQFAGDPYVASSMPASLLCAPITLHNSISGLIYLESNASEGAFTKERIEVLNLLSTQAAISLKHARLYDATGRFVPVQFLEQLKRKNLIDIKLGDHIKQSMSVFFCDIRNFTTLSEKLSPDEVFAFINRFLGHMEPIIRKYNGFIDKYIGDAIMALFKAEAKDALNAAIEMLEELKRFNLESEQKVSVGIGINTGEIVLGIMGGERHLAGSVIGDVVNAASRIEGLTKVYNTPLLIGENTKNVLSDPAAYCLRLIGNVLVKGKLNALEIWEVCDVDPEPVRELKMQNIQIFNHARRFFQINELKRAFDLFQKCYQLNPNDNVVVYYLKKCEELDKTIKR